MSDELTNTITRMEQWAYHPHPQFMTPFVADVQTLIRAAKVAKSAAVAAEMLKNAERIKIIMKDDELESYAVPSLDVDNAIDALLGRLSISRARLIRRGG
jgi:hypothetical protein